MPANMRHLLIAAGLAAALLLSGCGRESPSGSAAMEKAERTGTITVSGQTWTIVPAIQCSVYPGEVVAIAGHAAGNDQVEITIDHDPAGPVQVRVEGDGVNWLASGDDLDFQIDGNTVSGSGTFRPGPGGAMDTAPPPEVNGSFRVSC